MIIVPPYSPILSGITSGTFAIPLLPWTLSPVGLALTDLGSVRAMFTNVRKKAYGYVITHYLPHVTSAAALVASDLNILEGAILTDIHTATTSWHPTPPANPTDAVLTRIAVGIQLWGGNAGRGAFVQDGGFSANFNPAAYRQMIAELKKSVPAGAAGMQCPNLQNAVNIWTGRGFNQFGVSFATKHFCFWSKAVGMPNQLPIYDNIIAKIAMGHRQANWGHYWNYVNAMRSEVANINAANPHFGSLYTISQLERQLFNWANSPAAAYWNR